MVEQFKITDSDERIVAGWASVEIIDRQGDIVPVDVLERAMYKYVDRGGHILYGHSNMPVGKVLRWEVKEHPDTGKLGLWIEAKIFDDYSIDKQIWEAIKRGDIVGFSIAGVGKEKKVKIKSEDGNEVEADLVTELELTEISLVEEPANPLAKIESINWYAKGSSAVEVGDIVRIVDKTFGRSDVLGKVGVIVDVDSENNVCIVRLDDGDEVLVGTEKLEVVKGTKVEKDSCKSRYYDEDSGHFKEMTCPDGSGPSRFCGCVRYMMNCNGYDEETAKKICAKIYHEKYGKGEASGVEEDVIIQKPFAGFKDFNDCVKRMKEQYKHKYSGEKLEEVARKVCGKLYWEYEGKKKSLREFEKVIGAFPKPVRKQLSDVVEKLLVDVLKSVFEDVEFIIEPCKEEMGTVDMTEEEVPKVETKAEDEAPETGAEEEVKPRAGEAPKSESVKDVVDELKSVVAELTKVVGELSKVVTAAKSAEKAVEEVTTGEGISKEEIRKKLDEIRKRREELRKKMIEVRKRMLKSRVEKAKSVREKIAEIRKAKVVDTPAPGVDTNADVVDGTAPNEIIRKVLSGEIKASDLPKILKTMTSK